MTHPVTPTPDEVSRGIELLDLALQESSLPPAAYLAVTSIIGALEAAADVLHEAVGESGIVDYAVAAGALAFVLDTRQRHLATLGRQR